MVGQERARSRVRVRLCGVVSIFATTKFSTSLPNQVVLKSIRYEVGKFIYLLKLTLLSEKSYYPWKKVIMLLLLIGS